MPRIATYTTIELFKTKLNIASVSAADAEDLKNALAIFIVRNVCTRCS